MICTHAGTRAQPTELKWSNAHACLTLQGTAQRYSVWEELTPRTLVYLIDCK